MSVLPPHLLAMLVFAATTWVALIFDIRSTGAAEPAPVVAAGAQSGNQIQKSLNKAKRALAKIYEDHRTTLYCGCRFAADKQVDHASCGYVPQRNNARARRIEWEHVVPAEAFGRSFTQWRDGDPRCVNRKGKAFRGRQCARKLSAEFRLMEADMYNLYPAVGEVNEHRSNYSMAELPDEPREFGACDVEIADRKIEPRPAVRGDIARTYQYMDAAYPGRGIISSKNRKLLAAWATQDPVDAWECERARRIEQVQRNVNRVVAAACRQAGR